MTWSTHDPDKLIEYLFAPRARKPRPDRRGVLVALVPRYVVIDQGDQEAFDSEPGVSDAVWSGNAIAVAASTTRRDVVDAIVLEADEDRLEESTAAPELCGLELDDG